MTEALTLIAMAIGLSADALAVTVSDALTYSGVGFKRKLLLPTVFGLMQGIMPLIGYGLGMLFEGYIEAVDHWIALVLLTILGVKMIVETAKELRSGKKSSDGAEEQSSVKTLGFGTILVQGVATSIDAMAVGITIAVAVNVNVFVSAAVIAAVTFAVCFAGLFVGKAAKYFKGYAGIVGGAILIAVGIKIFVEHMIGA
ncbi:MAG: manganese efflux pump MntP family protein [Corallococcus sp.]|nr:manganese efflux pump MntP family protein [Corallococcus sp.]